MTILLMDALRSPQSFSPPPPAAASLEPESGPTPYRLFNRDQHHRLPLSAFTARGPAPPSVTANKPHRKRKLSAALFNSFLSRIPSRHARSESVQGHGKVPPHKRLNHVRKDHKSGNVFTCFARKLSLIRRRSVRVIDELFTLLYARHRSSRLIYSPTSPPPRRRSMEWTPYHRSNYGAIVRGMTEHAAYKRRSSNVMRMADEDSYGSDGNRKPCGISLLTDAVVASRRRDDLRGGFARLKDVLPVSNQKTGPSSSRSTRTHIRALQTPPFLASEITPPLNAAFAWFAAVAVNPWNSNVTDTWYHPASPRCSDPIDP
ncbi:unnamed protein product [Rhizoctonia solani]|uniref:BHLH domain-containing protein n=1 Tax=Rhizoctonia solani TaxID=456999 RepID=A0A8H3A4Y8_9AGAM|nr:unnamed protein product [Rhizoctonia solani]